MCIMPCHAVVDPEGLKAVRAPEYIDPLISWLDSLPFTIWRSEELASAIRGETC